MWTDAAGESRWLAAVVLVDGVFHWSRWKCDDRLWALLLPRLDHNIGTQEMMAVILGVYTWLDTLRDAVLTVYVDNEGVRYSMISGTSRLPEVTLSVARLWHLVADVRMGLLVRRVESKANLADGPTRENLKYLEMLHAIGCRPVLPEWVFDLWRYDGHAQDLCVRAEV